MQAILVAESQQKHPFFLFQYMMVNFAASSYKFSGGGRIVSLARILLDRNILHVVRHIPTNGRRNRGGRGGGRHPNIFADHKNWYIKKRN